MHSNGIEKKSFSLFKVYNFCELQVLQINTLMGATCIASLMSDSKLRLREKIVLTSKEDMMFFLNIDQAVCDM